MRRQDINIGAEVAYGRGPRDATWCTPVRVIVTSIDTTAGRTRVGIKPHPDDELSRYTPYYTRPDNIWRLWAEQEEINAARAKVDESKRAECVERRAKAVAAVEELLGMVPDGTDEATLVRRTRIPHDGDITTRRQFTLNEVLDIARAVAEQARKGE